MRVVDKFIRIGERTDGAVVSETRIGGSKIIIGHAYIELHEQELVVQLPVSPQLMNDPELVTFNFILAELYHEHLISDNYAILRYNAESSVFQHELRLKKFVVSVGWEQCYDNHDGLYHIPLAEPQHEQPQYEQIKNFEDMLCVL